MADDQKQQMNAQGHANGCYACPVCGDSHWWKAFHVTPYFAGRMGGDNGNASWDGELGLAALCVECFEKLTPEERLPHYQVRVSQWIEAVPSVKPVPAAVGLQPDPGDAARYAAAMAKHERDMAAITEAVLAGK